MKLFALGIVSIVACIINALGSGFWLLTAIGSPAIANFLCFIRIAGIALLILWLILVFERILRLILLFALIFLEVLALRYCSRFAGSQTVRLIN